MVGSIGGRAVKEDVEDARRSIRVEEKRGRRARARIAIVSGKCTGLRCGQVDRKDELRGTGKDDRGIVPV